MSWHKHLLYFFGKNLKFWWKRINCEANTITRKININLLLKTKPPNAEACIYKNIKKRNFVKFNVNVMSACARNRKLVQSAIWEPAVHRSWDTGCFLSYAGRVLAVLRRKYRLTHQLHCCHKHLASASSRQHYRTFNTYVTEFLPTFLHNIQLRKQIVSTWTVKDFVNICNSTLCIAPRKHMLLFTFKKVIIF